MVSKKKMPRGRQTTKSGTRKAVKKAKPTESAAQDATCVATTVKGTRCKLRARDGSDHCARHADQARKERPTPRPAGSTRKATPMPGAMKNGEGRRAQSAALDDGKDAAAAEPPRPRAGDDTQEGPPGRGGQEIEAQADGETEAEAQGDLEEDVEPEAAFYGSEFSTTMEASPYEDMLTPEMAEGEEEVELRDEQEFGRDAHRQKRPRPTREQAEERARERLGERPTIAPEEDLDGTLADYDRRFESEVRRLMGHGQRHRGRRGGRRRRRGSGGGQQGGGHQQPGQPRHRRGRRGGGRGGRQGGRKRPSGRSGPPPGAARKVARDSPLANRRGSRGPKRGVQPRRRREPDV